MMDFVCDAQCSSDGDDEMPSLQRLFGDGRDTESSNDDSASDKEWKEAIKATVETEIQYQVQLRLALTPISLKKEVQKEDLNDALLLQRSLRSTSEEKCENLVEESLAAEFDSNNKACSHSRNGTNEPADAPAKESLHAVNQHLNANGKHKLSDKYRTVYDYVSSKYGTPRDQLEQLLSHGKFVCGLEDQEERIKMGIDERLRWPVECKIKQRTPVHAIHHKQDHTLLAPAAVEPLLGYNRPQFNRSGCPLSIAYDSHAEVITTNNNDKALERNDEMSNKANRGKLKFESQFECGNLRQALQVGSTEYDLILNTDLYTERHTQWFYFKITNMLPQVTYTFNIINFRKKDSLYNHGMKILMYSETDESWQRVGHDISYHKMPNYKSPLLKNGTDYYYLSWKMEFTHENDTCYFSHCYPYSFSSLLAYIDTLENKKFINKETLCQTLAGNPCPLITITNFDTSEGHWSQKMGVVFTARVHPGETNSSWMMQGILQYLTSDHKHAKYLRNHFVFKIVPMLNPDGVIVGNYRTSLSGVDLNRIYRNPIEKLFPTVYHVKKLVESLAEERRVALYVDLHGHSRNYNVFMYGCHTPQCDHTQFLQERVVPWLLSQISKDKFSFKACKFAVQRCKESTGRVTVWRMGVANSFTLEASFCGTNLTKPFPVHFTQQDLMDSGKNLCELLLKLQHYHKSPSYQYKVHCRIAEFYMQQLENNQPMSRSEDLPDIVASTRPDKEESIDEKKRKTRQKMAKCLHEFQGLSMKLLTMESSTSGSDSDDDEFKFKQKSKKQKRQKQSKKASSSSRAASNARGSGSVNINSNKTNIDDGCSNSKQTTAGTTPFTTQPEKDKEVEKGETRGNNHSNSAPPRLQRASHPLNSWKFINKYSNRSNGGIPMFAEERLKERLEKQLKNTSVTEFPSDSTTTFPAINTETMSAVSLMSPRATATHSNYMWKPSAGQHFPLLPEIPKPSHRSLHKNPLSQSTKTLSHYQHIKGLVESRKMAIPLLPSGSKTIVKHHHSHHPHKLTARESPELSQYISQIWHKHLGQLNGKI